jgi:D-alanine-D-alanine ligase-like ATP-grasp enzyme
MEQNSLVFMQAAVCGLSHQRLCEHIIKIASQKIVAPTLQPKVTAKPLVKKKKVFIVFGGETAERQVSLMSGSNVWLKLRASSLYEPIPYLLALDHCLYQIAYHHMLYHTIEEIYEHVHYTTHCPSPISLDLQDIKQASFSSSPLTITEFCSYAQKQDAFVFLALHGGEGEDGSWQRRLSEYKIPFNGSYEQGSALGMDKYLTAIMINELQLNHLYALPKILINLNEYPTVRSLEVLMSHFELDQYWIIKPRHDGCSAGIIVLSCFRDLQRYYELIVSEQSVIPAGLFYSQNQPVELPKKAQEFIIERYIQTDRVLSVDGKIHRQQVSGWLELTQTVLEFQGSYHAFEPSLTLSSGAVLSLEEKFQGGTGTNLTPIPFLSEDDRSCLKESLCLAAKALAIYNYARFDLFYHQELKEIIIIEVNTLPALTASTVLFHQALAEEVPYHPTELLELLITRSLLDKAVFYAQDAGNKDNHIEKSSVLMNSEL